MSTTQTIRCGAMSIAFALGSVALNLSAQQAAPKDPVPASPAPKSVAPAPQPAAGNSTASEAKAKILASQPWQQIMAEYQKWLSSQTIYTPADVKRINADLAAQFQSMSAADLQEYLDDWQAKLKVLNGKNFQEAQQWLGLYLQPCTDGFRAKTLKQLGLTDVANLSAAQLEDAILQIRADRLALQQSQAAFNQSRQLQVQSYQKEMAATQQADTARYGSGPGFNTLQSPYRPPKFNPPPQPQMQFYMDGYGRIGYALPF